MTSCLATESGPPRPPGSKPLASKLVITGSGFSLDEREVLKEWVQQLGAQYSGALVCGTTTHLVSRNLMNLLMTPKYFKAVHWGIAIVSFHWVYDSLRAGKLLPLSAYKSDQPGPADIALRGAALQRAKQAEKQRPPLQVICPNVLDEHAGLCHLLEAELKLGGGKDASGIVNQKKRPAASWELISQQLEQQQLAAHDDDFTFDVPSESSDPVASPRLCGAASERDPADCSILEAAASHLEAVQQDAGAQLNVTGKPASGGAAPAVEDGPLSQDAAIGKNQLQEQQQRQADPVSTPSIEISLTQLECEGTITVGDVTSGPMQPDGSALDDSTPTSGVSFNGFYVNRRVAAVRSTRLILGEGAPDGAGVAAMASALAVAVTNAPLPECIELLSPCVAATPGALSSLAGAGGDGGGGRGGGGGERMAPPTGAIVPQACLLAKAAPTPQQPASSAVLYSGFDLPLAVIATATKGRRLLRNDRRLAQMVADPNGGSALSAALRRDEQGLQDSDAEPSHAHLEDDLGDDLEDDLEDPVPAPALASAVRQPAVRHQVATNVAAGRAKVTGSTLAVEDAGKRGSSTAAPVFRGMQECCCSTTQAGQPQQQAMIPAPPRYPTHQPQRHPAALREAAELSQGQSQAASTQGPLTVGLARIKPDPGLKEGGHQIGPVGPVLQPEPSITGSYAHESAAAPPRWQQSSKNRSQIASRTEAVRNSSSLVATAAVAATLAIASAAAVVPQLPLRGAFPGVAIKKEPEVDISDDAESLQPPPVAVRPSERRRAAALATSSLVSEPVPIAHRPTSAAVDGNAAAVRGRTTRPQQGHQQSTRIAAAASLDGGLDDADDGDFGEGYTTTTTTTSMGDIPTDMMDELAAEEGVEASAWGECGSSECSGGAKHPMDDSHGGEHDVTAGQGHGHGAGEDCLTPEDVQPVGLYGRELPRGSHAGPKTINRILSIRTGGLTPFPPSNSKAIMPGATPDVSSEPDNDTPAASAAVAAAPTGKTRAPARSRLAAGSRPALIRKPILACPAVVGDTAATASGDSGGDDDDDNKDGDQDEDFAPSRGRATKAKTKTATTAAIASKPPTGRTLTVLRASQPHSTSMSVSSSLLPPGSQSGEGLCQWQPPLTEDRSISRYLREAVRMSEEHLKALMLAAGGDSSGNQLLQDDDVQLVKAMSRAPRNNTVRERHPGVTLKMVEFAEQVAVGSLKLLLDCRDRSRRARCPIVALPSTAGEDATGGDLEAREVFLAEPCVMYRLPSGEWWLEYYRYYSKSDLAAFATATGRPVNVPRDFEGRRELMRDTDRSHCRVIHVRGDLGVMRTKKHPPASTTGRPGGRPAFCRYIFDSHTGEALTDQAGKDFVVDS